MFAAFPDSVVELCRHKAAGNAYDKWSNDSFLHKIHLPRCRGIPMVRGRGKNSIAQNHYKVRVTWTKIIHFVSPPAAFLLWWTTPPGHRHVARKSSMAKSCSEPPAKRITAFSGCDAFGHRQHHKKNSHRLIDETLWYAHTTYIVLLIIETIYSMYLILYIIIMG